jgi:uncharacterized protein (DUF736 family)
MKKIGCFRQEGQSFNGNITTLQFSVAARLVPNEEKVGASSPDYLLVQDAKAESEYLPEIGSAWNKVSRQGNLPYLAVEIDDPSCQHPILATLWQAEDGLWYLYWNRFATGSEDAERLFVQEELKPPTGWHRQLQANSRYMKEVYALVV